jgi:hypothetical protein
MNAPEMAGWNLVLRFALELSSLTGFAVAAWHFSSGALRWVAVIVAPVLAAIIWGTFNVLDDPSRSGEAPVEVSGWIRLGVELLVLGGGVLAFALAGRSPVAITLGVLILAHYAASLGRVEWLIEA